MSRSPMFNTELDDFNQSLELSGDISGTPAKVDHCVVLCKRIGPNMFSIEGGLAIIDEEKGDMGLGALSAKCVTKVIFLPNDRQPEVCIGNPHEAGACFAKS